MIAGRSAPYVPRFIAARQLPTRYLAAVMAGAVPVLRLIERVVSMHEERNQLRRAKQH